MTEHRFEPFCLDDEGGRYLVEASIRTFQGDAAGDRDGDASSPSGQASDDPRGSAAPVVRIRFGNSFTLSAMSMRDAGRLRDLLDEVLAPGPQPWRKP